METHGPDATSVVLRLARRVAMRWCASATEADDIAQDVVVLLLRQPAPPRNLETWTFVVTRRLSHRRQCRENARINAEAAYGRRGRVEITPNDDLLIDLRVALGKLEPRDSRLLMRVTEGAVSSEIALEFGCHVRDVGQMVSRARRKVRRALEIERKRSRG